MPVTFIIFRRFTLAELLIAHDPFGERGLEGSLERHAVRCQDAIRIEAAQGVL